MNDKKFPVTENICGHSGGGICSNPPAPTPPVAPPPPSNTVNPAPLELHVCMGLNCCKGHDRYGTNSCAGAGYCATAAVHHCRTLNNCRGQGGCGLYGTAEDDATPGANDCAWQGACAVPIQAERFSTQGANKGLSVWVLARKLFEERMQRAKRTVNPSPFPCGPPEAWLTQALGSYDSCGSAGDKYCTFGFNNPAKDAQELCEKSLHPALCGNHPQSPTHCGGAPEKDAASAHCSTPESSQPNAAGDAGKSGEQSHAHCGAPKNSESVHCGTPEKESEANLCKSPPEKSNDTNLCNSAKKSGNKEPDAEPK